jgi:hypothetical protein
MKIRIAKSIIGAIFGVLAMFIIHLIMEDDYSVPFYIAIFIIFGLVVFFSLKPRLRRKDNNEK